MNKENEKYLIEKMYLKEFQFFNGEYDITFNIVDINTDKMIIKLAVTNLGKISVIEYDLKKYVLIYNRGAKIFLRIFAKSSKNPRYFL